ncbi:hypothetical protein [Escherichia coli]
MSALDDDIITTEQALEIAIRCPLTADSVISNIAGLTTMHNSRTTSSGQAEHSGGVVTPTQYFEPWRTRTSAGGVVADHHTQREHKQRTGEFESTIARITVLRGTALE